MKRLIYILPIVILALSLKFLPTVNSNEKTSEDDFVYTMRTFQYDDKKCSFCHNDIIKHELLHAPVADDCESCHMATGNKHPKANVQGFTLAEKTPDLCYICHEAKNDKKNIHAPAETGDCNSCHSPHGSNFQYLLPKASSSNMCAECHDIDLSENMNIHAPIELDGCFSCHDSHQSDHDHLLTESKTNLCLICHDNIESEKNAEFLHAPFEDDCSNCHDPHSSKEQFLLTSASPELCFNCHDDIGLKLKESKFVHKVSENDDIGCRNCHSAHASSHSKMLLEEPRSLCFKCHDKEINTGTKIIENFKEKLQNAKYKHTALEAEGCFICHDPHASDHESLLTASFPQGEYLNASIESFDLCFSCHDTDLLEKEYSSTATNFRNGDHNLHFVHINGEKGRNCNICHDIHVSKNAFLIKNRTKYGTWDMPMNFSLKENGASCRTGCHTELEYNRKTPFKYDDLNALNDSTEMKKDSILIVKDTLITVNDDPVNDQNIDTNVRDSVITARDETEQINDSTHTEADTSFVVTDDPVNDQNIETNDRDSLISARDETEQIIDSTHTETDTSFVVTDDPVNDQNIETNERDSLISARDETEQIIDSIHSEKDTVRVIDDPLNIRVFSVNDAFDKIKHIKVYFKYAKTDVAENADDKILIWINFMNTFPEVLIEVGGHTDSKGSVEYNIELSRKRAQAIKRILNSKGIIPERIEVKAYGESYPIDTNSTDEGRANNRRVEFKLKQNKNSK